MDRYEIGMFARSLAGHDKDNLYVIVNMEEEYVYLADGKLKLVDRPKKKKKKHIQIIREKDEALSLKLQENHKVSDVDVKRAIKMKTQRR